MAQDIGLGGAGMLGAAFGGAPRLRQAAYEQEQNNLARAFAEAAAAHKDQSVADLNSNRLAVLGGLKDTFQRAGMSPEKAALAAAAVAAASTSNPNQIIGAGQQLQAQDAGLGGDTQAMNVINSARTGKPLDMVKIEGNTALNPNLAPDAQSLNPTEVGQSVIGKNTADAGAAGALAGQRNTLTPLLAALDQARTAAAQAQANKTNTGRTGKPPALTPALAKLLGDLDTNTGALNPKGAQDAAILAANPTAGAMAGIQARQPMTTQPLENPGLFSAGNLGSNFYAGDGAPPYTVPSAPDAAATDSAGALPTDAQIPGNVRFAFAPGTDPSVIAATKAAAAAEARLPKNAPAPKTVGKVASPVTQAQFDALPSGALFVNPADGKTYRKK